MTFTPLSDSLIDSLPDYFAEVRSKMERGKRDYGDSSLTRPLVELARELRAEAVDLAGWGAIVWKRSIELEVAIEALEAKMTLPK
jgi:hypothetical protein